MDHTEVSEDISGPSSLSSDQASLCVIPDPDDSSEDDDFIHLDKNSLPVSLTCIDADRTSIVFHSVDEEYSVQNDVLCQYMRPKGWSETPKDFIGLFKVGWVNVGECMAMVPVSETSNPNNSIGYVSFGANSLPNDDNNFYQFCYLRETVLLGASTPFQFKLSTDKDCLVNQMEQKLTEQLRNRDLDLIRLQEKFTKLACSKDEQDKVYFSTVEGLEKQIIIQSVSIKKLVEEKVTLESEKSHLSQEIINLSALVEELKMKLSYMDCFSQQELCLNSLESSIAAPSDHSKVPEGSLFDDKISSASSVNISNIDQSLKKTDEMHLNDFTKHSSEAELTQLRQRLKEVIEEKQFFQEQYGVASLTLKKCTDELTKLKVYVSELHVNHETVVEELSEKLKASNDNVELQKAISENVYLKEELDYLRNVIKKLEEGIQKTGCRCEDFKKKMEEVTVRLSASDLIKATLQAELDEELKLGEDRDHRLAQLEQTMLSTLRSQSEQAVTAFEAGSVTSMYEMEQNVKSALEALECALKEIETLRARKAALNRTNRALRDGITKEKNDWEEMLEVERKKYDSHVMELTNQLKSESTEKLILQKKVQKQCDFNVQHFTELGKRSVNDQNKELENTHNDLEALDAAQKEIDLLRDQRANLLEQCDNLRQQLDEKKHDCVQRDSAQDHSCGFAGKLQEACEEYRKLYVEKKRIQEKLDRLQQKIKMKANSRVRSAVLPSSDSASQTLSASSLTNSDDPECASCRSAAWRAMVEELM